MSLTRRAFLTTSAGAAAAFSAGTPSGRAGQLPGQPATGGFAVGERNFANVMAIAAHPGDAFFAMGAPVAVGTRSGGPGWFLSLSLGERGSAKIPVAQYEVLQREAAEKAAALLGAQALFLHYPDGEIPVTEEAKFAVCDFIREHKPATVVTHWKGSWHKDHRACYEVVQDAIFYAGLPAISRKQRAHAVSKLYFADNWEDAADFVVDTYLDITPVYEKWLNACSAFPMWRGENGFRYNDYYASRAITQGCVSNFQRAVALMSPEDQRVRHIPTP